MRHGTDWEAGINWDHMRAYRVNRMTDYMQKHNIDAILTTKIDTIRYLNCFRPVYAMFFHCSRIAILLRKDGRMKFYVPSGDYDRVKKTMPWVKEVEAFPFLFTEGAELICNGIEELGLSKGTIGVDIIPYGAMIPMQKRFPEARFVDGAGAFDYAASIKCPEEIQCLREAAIIVDIGTKAGIDAIRDGVTEMSVARAIVSAIMARDDIEDVPAFPLVISGKQGELGYRFPTDKVIRRGETVFIDCGNAIINGYHGDISRTVMVGEPTRELKEVYRVVYDMLKAGIDKLRPGTPLEDVAAAVHNVALNSKYKDYVFYGIVGHGIGTDIHVAPTIGDLVVKDIDREIKTVEENMVIMLEPGLQVPGVGAVHLEDMTLVTKNGPEVLTLCEFDEKMLK